MERAIAAVNRAASSNTVVNVFLLGVFGALSVRSLQQQKDIDALEAEKNSLLKSNKDMRKTIWNWKQQLYADAQSQPSSSRAPLVPLSRLKAIYGDRDDDENAPSSPSSSSAGGNSEGGGKKPGSRLMI